MDIKKVTIAFGLMAAVYAGATKYEAESANLGGDAAKSGTYVDLNTGSISFDNVSVNAAGKYTLVIHCAGAYGEKDNNIVVNGAAAGSFHVDEGNDYVDISSSVTLKAGTNTVAITSSWGWIKVDYIEINSFESKAFNISPTLVTANATAEAVKLYTFLVNNFGTKTISGIMTGNMDNYTLNNDFKTHEDVADIYARSGKYPALVGFDFLFSTGPNASGDWNKAYDQKALFLAKNLWSQGGIPAFSWHWKDPTDKVDAFYATQKAAGDGKEFTTFRVSEAFVSGTTNWNKESNAYKGIIADIDYIADYFLQLQEAGVAAIFRPLHEAGGDWFWWSNSTSGEQYAALYRLVYDEMVNVKGVRNLVWVFNPEASLDVSWDPGADYYDVISVDIYNNDNDHSSNSAAFDTFKDKWGTSKILALSENGPIPDVSNMHTDQAVWSWWMPWYSSWSGKWPGQTSNSVWKNNMEDDRIITFEDMPGWDSNIELSSNSNVSVSSNSTSPTSSASNSANSNNNSTTPGSNSSNTEAIGASALPVTASLTLQGSSLSFTTIRATSVSLDVFDLQGNRVMGLYKGVLSAGTHQFSLSGMARGPYIVRAKGAGIAVTQKVIVR
ncbi:MAG: beta-mannosidase [Fibrobacter sp.]|nr:beta-mannosidase [Fibrobacter sp.]